MADNTPNKINHYSLKNVMEEVIQEKVISIWKDDKNNCHCDKCFNDVCAIVLNKTPPHYVNTQRGALLARIPEMSMERQMALTVDVLRAVKLVGEKPQHEPVPNK